ncbi:hypothetical protein VNO78_11949 [Psophocarpus tetragonolobus]|uniref:Uncharacterized protein n=1 Tax=Psophocarpus tetragonolobus TaxID=3891 RepID=A0AAN9XPF4_PSOTE
MLITSSTRLQQQGYNCAAYLISSSAAVQMCLVGITNHSAKLLDSLYILNTLMVISKIRLPWRAHEMLPLLVRASSCALP